MAYPAQEGPIDKQQVDIDLTGGMDESAAEEVVDWTKRFTNIENLVPNLGSYKVRPGLALMANVDDASTSLSPVHRLVGLEGGGVGAVCQSFNLAQWSDNTLGFFNKGKLPEFSVTGLKAGTSSSPSTYAGVAGVAVTTKYVCVAYVGESNDTTNPVTWLHIDVLDKTGTVIVKSYRYEAALLCNFAMVGVDSRYLHIYQSANTIKPRMFVIDTNSLPAGPTLSPSFTDTTNGTTTNNKVMGLVAISGASVVLHTVTGFGNYIEKFNNSAASTGNASAGGSFSSVSGLATDGTNFYISGYSIGFTSPTSTFLTGYWREYPGGTPWNGTASTGTSGGKNLTMTTTTQGTAQNGFFPCLFNGTDNAQIATTINTFLTGTAGTIIFCIRPTAYDVAATSATLIGVAASLTANNSLIRICKPYGFYFGQGTIDGTAPYLPAAVNRYHFLAYKWDATYGYIKLNRGDWVKSTAIQPSAFFTGFGASNLGVGTCQGANSWELMAAITQNATMSDRDVEDILSSMEARYALTF